MAAAGIRADARRHDKAVLEILERALEEAQ